MSAESLPATAEDTTAKYSPLFTEANEKGELPTAQQIARIRLYRWLPGAGNNRPLRKVIVPRWEYAMEGGKRFEINVFETEEDDLATQFGGGDFYIEPIGYDNRPLPCGHTLPLPGRPRFKSVKEMEAADPAPSGADDETSTETQTSELFSGRGMNDMMQETIRRLESRVEELSRGKESPSAAQEISRVALSRDEASADAMRALREELSKAHSSHAHAVEELHRTHREEVVRLNRTIENDRDTQRKQLDETREDYVARRRAVDLQLDTINGEKNRAIDAERRRADKEIEELKASQREALENLRRDRDAILMEERRQAAAREKDLETRYNDLRERFARELGESTKGVEDRIAQASSRHERRARDLEKDLEETRIRLNNEIAQLRKEKLQFEKENIELLQEIASKPDGDEDEPEPPGAPGVLSSAEKPWQVAMAERFLGPAVDRLLAGIGTAPAAAPAAAQQISAPQPAPQQQTFVPQQPLVQQQAYVPAQPVQQPFQSPAPVATEPFVAAPDDAADDFEHDDDGAEDEPEVPSTAWSEDE